MGGSPLDSERTFVQESGRVPLEGELARLHAMLQRGVARFRALREDTADVGLGGLTVFDREVDELLARPPLAAAAGSLALEYPAGPLTTLGERFGLSHRELDVLLLCAAGDLHPGYGRVFAYLQNDVARLRPSVGLALELVAGGWEERLSLRLALGRAAPLRRYRLVELAHGGARAFLEDALVLDEAVLRFLVEGGRPDATRMVELCVSPEAVIVDPRTRERVLDACGRGHALVSVRAPGGAGKRTVAAALAQASGLELSAAVLADAAHGDGLELVQDAVRDACLAGAGLCLDAGSLSAEEVARAIGPVRDALAEGCLAMAFVLMESAQPLPLAADGADVVDVPLPPWSFAQRLQAWRLAASAESLELLDSDLDSVSSVFRLSPATIRRAARALATQVRRRRARGPTLAELQAACRAESRHGLDRLAERVPCVHDWGDIVLPREQAAQLHELAQAVAQRRKVLDEWGFGRKVALSPGITALFHGPSGTGKTMAAGIVARALGMDLYRIDLSRVVSKWVGETEKNLEAIFQEGSRAHSLLFFDEADALFGKRSEVREAQDRFANIEVSYLLQRMESYDGLAVLATNLRRNMDAAFVRRLQFTVEFPVPTAAQRLEIWRRIWPAESDLAGGLDLQFLASRFEWSGGNIRNIALRAAYLAATARSPVRMEHLVLATRREQQKLGQLSVANDFGNYRALLEADP